MIPALHEIQFRKVNAKGDQNAEFVFNGIWVEIWRYHWLPDLYDIHLYLNSRPEDWEDVDAITAQAIIHHINAEYLGGNR